MRSLLFSILCGVVAQLVPVPAAAADILGSAGKLAGLRQVNSGSDNFGKYHGSVWVDAGKNNLTEYYWGGSSCPGLNLTEDEVANLSRGLGNPKLRFVPIYKIGQGGRLCLVQFLIVDKKVVDAVDPFPFGN